MKSTKRDYVPERTCMGCRRVRPKTELIRIVSNGGKLKFDLSSVKPGRGAYICPTESCWKRALAGDHLENALKTNVKQEVKEELLKDISRINKYED